MSPLARTGHGGRIQVRFCKGGATDLLLPEPTSLLRTGIPRALLLARLMTWVGAVDVVLGVRWLDRRGIKVG